jgi:hypothetical protein
MHVQGRGRGGSIGEGLQHCWFSASALSVSGARGFHGRAGYRPNVDGTGTMKDRPGDGTWRSRRGCVVDRKAGNNPLALAVPM